MLAFTLLFLSIVGFGPDQLAKITFYTDSNCSTLGGGPSGTNELLPMTISFFQPPHLFRCMKLDLTVPYALLHLVLSKCRIDQQPDCDSI